MVKFLYALLLAVAAMTFTIAQDNTPAPEAGMYVVTMQAVAPAIAADAFEVSKPQSYVESPNVLAGVDVAASIFDVSEAEPDSNRPQKLSSHTGYCLCVTGKLARTANPDRGYHPLHFHPGKTLG